jgi:hypothetical protein
MAAMQAARPLWLQAQRDFERQNGRDRAAALRTTLKALKVGVDTANAR